MKRSVLLAVVLTATACGVREVRGRVSAMAPVSGTPGRTVECVALSGGGIRSGAVSLGVLQELSARRSLDRVAYLSSVSGGGYPVYGLLHRMRKDRVSVASLLDEHGRHIRKVDAESHFLGGNSLRPVEGLLAFFLWSPLSWFSSGYSGAQPTYSAKIHGTFAGGVYPLFRRLPRLSDAQGDGFPLPIFGAAVSRGLGMPVDATVYTAADYFEMAPDVSGSAATGWIDSLPFALDLAEVVAISAAGIDLPRESKLYNAQRDWGIGAGMSVRARAADGTTTDFYLADAGPVDNLGLLPLLRRNCTSVLVVDNTFDPNAKFEDWRQTMSRAKDLGWTVTSELAPSVASTGASDRGAWQLPTHRWNARLARGDRAVAITVLKLGYSESESSRYPQEVVEKAAENWRRFDRRCNDATGLRARCGFPMESTIRQSFSVSEFRAYRKLGRCMVRLAAAADESCDF